MTSALRAPFALVIALSLAAPGVVRAEPNAETLNQEGIKAAQAKDWEQARQRFTESYTLDPRPTTLYNRANAEERTDHLIAARDSYTKYLADTPPGDHDAFRARATKALAALDEAIPTLRIVATGFPATAVLSLDGQDVTAKLDAPIPIDPGEHAVQVRNGPDVLTQRSVTVQRGAREQMELAGRHDDTALAHPDATPPNGAAIAIATQIPPPRPTTRSHHSVFASPWFWGATSAVVLGIAAGSYYHFVYEVTTPTRGTLGEGIYHVP